MENVTLSPQSQDISTDWSGLFIVFEGIDGTGKSSQIKRLAHTLRSQNHTVVTTREPSDGIFGTRLRNLFYQRETISKKEELELFLNDRKEHLAQTILPALQKGTIVLCDRYFLSTIAYQGAGSHFSVESLQRENSFAPPPDIALLLTAPVATCLQRISTGRGEHPNDFEQQDFLEKVEDIFFSLKFPWIKDIDCNHSIDVVEEAIWQRVQPLLKQYKERR